MLNLVSLVFISFLSCFQIITINVRSTKVMHTLHLSSFTISICLLSCSSNQFYQFVLVTSMGSMEYFCGN